MIFPTYYILPVVAALVVVNALACFNVKRLISCHRRWYKSKIVPVRGGSCLKKRKKSVATYHHINIDGSVEELYVQHLRRGGKWHL